MLRGNPPEKKALPFLGADFGRRYTKRKAPAKALAGALFWYRTQKRKSQKNESSAQ